MGPVQFSVPASLAGLVAVPAPEDPSIGPGLAGFLVMFALALATVLLIRSMVGHLRKVRYGPGPDDEPTVPEGRAHDGHRPAGGPQPPQP